MKKELIYIFTHIKTLILTNNKYNLQNIKNDILYYIILY